jgi:hypothetical protein
MLVPKIAILSCLNEIIAEDTKEVIFKGVSGYQTDK